MFYILLLILSEKVIFLTYNLFSLLLVTPKNATDWFFNALKLYYCDENIFSMNTVIKLYGQPPQVTSTRVYFNDMYNWED